MRYISWIFGLLALQVSCGDDVTTSRPAVGQQASALQLPIEELGAYRDSSSTPRRLWDGPRLRKFDLGAECTGIFERLDDFRSEIEREPVCLALWQTTEAQGLIAVIKALDENGCNKEREHQPETCASLREKFSAAKEALDGTLENVQCQAIYVRTASPLVELAIVHGCYESGAKRSPANDG